MFSAIDNTLLNIIPAIGWTLLHSLWQGLAIASIALIILWLTKKSSPAFRYNALIGALGLFLVVVATTFYLQLNDSKQTVVNKSVVHEAQATTSSHNIETYNTGFLNSLETTLNKYIDLIVVLWFILLCAQGVRLVLGLRYINKIRTKGTALPSEEWLTMFEQLKKELRISKPVKLLESHIVNIPVVTGFFRPLILIPASLMMNLPYDQVRSILLHELAHIRREDYLVNIMQNIIDTIFFFNPAILWLSATIRDEREACCDEVALNYTHSKADYLQALVSFQEYSIKSNGLALAFPGKNRSLLQRVKRIIYNENKNLNFMQKTILICSIVLLTAASIIPANEIKAWNIIPLKIQALAFNAPDSIPAPIEKPLPVLKPLESKKPSEPLKPVDIKPLETMKSIDPISPPPTAPSEQVPAPIEPVPAISVVPPVPPVPPVAPVEKKDCNKSSREVVSIHKNCHSTEEHKDVEQIVQTLVSNNIVKADEPTTFKLSYNELIVNKVRQAASLHQQLKEKFIKHENDFYSYSVSNGNKNLTVNKED